MPRLFSQLLQAWAERRRARRRQANLRAGARSRARPQLVPVAARAPMALPSSRSAWLWTLLAVLLVLAGAALIVGHARHLGAPVPVSSTLPVDLLRSALPGAVFTVPQRAGATTSLHAEGALLVLAGMEAAPVVRVDLCSQLRSPGTHGDARLLPLRLGERFADVERQVADNLKAGTTAALRNVLLVSDSGAGVDAMPQVRIEGNARADFADPLAEPLRLSWRSRQGDARWIADASLGQVEQGAAGQVALRRQGWLLWGAASALRLERRANVLCPRAGELLVQLYRRAAPSAADGATALVVAFPARGAAVRTRLAPGSYRVPVGAAPALEDQVLFGALQAAGLLRLSSTGVIELAPRDLPQWVAAGPADRVAHLDDWRHVASGAATDKLLKRLYYQADGAYVRQQVDIFNGERRLLAWRVRSDVAAAPEWRASTDGGAGNDSGSSGDSGPVMVATTTRMPVAAARLFATLPQGWQPWTRVARWPLAGEGGDGGHGSNDHEGSNGRNHDDGSNGRHGRSAPLVRLAVTLPQAAAGGEVLRLFVAGTVVASSGAAMRSVEACTGRACASAADVQDVSLTLHAGAREVAVTVRPLAFSAPDDERYRHLRLAGGKLVWQALAGGASMPSPAPSSVRLFDRYGAPLWDDGAPTEAAGNAGLAPLLGVGPGHASSVAGMLARLPAAGKPVTATLTLDLPLQALSQRILDCVGMRQGRWTGAGAGSGCAGRQAVPAGRRAGLVILDTDTGDVLAAAGAGGGAVNATNWAEVRDHDRTNPARSALRLPALQHDGGAHQSPGSTFKVISALGLEMAARKDPQLDALLGGLPLPAINALARQRGFGFETGAPTYPQEPRPARITNYREQGLDRRAQDGRLGLAQALTYSLNTWFAWTGELSDRSLFGRPDGGAPGVQALDADALDAVRPIVAAAHRLGFEQPVRLDGGLLPADFDWRNWDALLATPAHIDTIHTRHELRQMAIGLRMQVTPLHMALASAAVGQGKVVVPRLLLELDGKAGTVPAMVPTGVRLDRILAGMKGVVDAGTGAGAFGGPALAAVRRGLYGKTGTAPTGDDTATVWFTGWLEPGTLPGQAHRLAFAAFVSHSESTGGGHAAPVVAAVLSTLAAQKPEQRGK
ncbi:cell division protein FtsI/penicillin-binding protein 2 [Duganella sp. 3397]|uniref:penicillin-binding transpeptidase domain-containing protein n=1 Tax=Duganella sp. 3397 TaxID=2817732 RepID=UPI00285A7714|nr:penicillin-binding transpeptidase domain-containing protein [Duganella sp. 3397]MDR7049398.1 cell division protein FtsI/penicillin-binding protein 2 [Duganella sp. 3397]